MVILWYYNGIIIEGKTTLLVFYHYTRSIQKRARKIPHDQGNSLVVWGNHINYAKRKTRIELVRMVFYFI